MSEAKQQIDAFLFLVLFVFNEFLLSWIDKFLITVNHASSSKLVSLPKPKNSDNSPTTKRPCIHIIQQSFSRCWLGENSSGEVIEKMILTISIVSGFLSLSLGAPTNFQSDRSPIMLSKKKIID